MKMHRLLPEKAVIKGCSIAKKADGWYAALSLEIQETAVFHPSNESVGIDVGLTSFAVLSNGEQIKPPKFLRKSEKKLEQAQKSLSRKKRGSKRRRKQKIQVARLHARIARQRSDFLFKLSSKLAHQFRLIGLENLNIKGMIKNHHLAKSISDASWHSFRQKLAHAAVKTGAKLMAVEPRGTTQRCSGCSKVVPKTLSEPWHSCTHCGLSLSRDHNAAINIHQLAVLADSQEVTPRETRSVAFRYRKVRSVVELGTVPAQSRPA